MRSIIYFCGISGCSFISDAEYGLGRRPRVIVGREAESDTCGLENKHSSVETGASEKEPWAFCFISDPLSWSEHL